MIRQGYDFGVERAFRQRDLIRLWFGRYDDQGRFCYAEQLTFNEPSNQADNFEPPPSMYLKNEEAQRLADQLWAAGVRPTQSQQGQGMFEAQGRHLNDMRAIVGSKLNITLKEKE